MLEVSLSVFQDVCVDTPVYGFDLASRKIAFVGLSELGATSSTCSVKKSSRAAELAELHQWVEDIYAQLPPGYVYIEAPVVGRGGARPTILQSQVDGLIQSLSIRFAHLGVYTVNNKTWKKDIVGNGNASKDDTTKWLASYHPVLSDMAGDDQDLVDAAGVALYGVSVLKRSREHFPRTIRVDT